MSTEYKTIPPIKYEDVIKHPLFHCVREDGYFKPEFEPCLVACAEQPKTIWLFKQPDGSALFERYGAQNDKILCVIARAFNVAVESEYGEPFCDANGIESL